MTTAMSTPHEITYSIYVYISDAYDEKETATKEDQKIPGLTYLSTDANDAAGLFEVYRYEDGYVVIRVSGVGRYLIVPEGKAVPAPLENDIQVVQQPVSNIYVSDENLFETLAGIDGADLAPLMTMTGFEGAEGTKYTGAYDELDLAQLLRNKCGLAVLPGTCADHRVTGWAEDDPEAVTVSGLDDEKAAGLGKVFEALKGFGIPGFVDRSADETTEQGALEWLKLYGILLGCEDVMVQAYETMAADLADAAA